jgi:hypothetical protein
VVLLETGIPLAATARLTPEDVSLYWNLRIRYFPRLALRARYAEMSPSLEAALWEWLPHCGSRRVFPGRTWRHYRTPQRAIRAFCRANGIDPPITCQQLRWFHAEYGPGGWRRPSDATETAPPRTDFGALAEDLLRSGHGRSSQLVKFMEHRTAASFQDVIDGVFGDDRSDEAIRSLVNRTNNALHELGSPLKFATKASQVLKKDGHATAVQQAERPCNG